MQKWEYYWNDIDENWLNEELHTYGEQGWELVSVIANGSRYKVFFKRPKS